jgi:hypothetical protein
MTDMPVIKFHQVVTPQTYPQAQTNLKHGAFALLDLPSWADESNRGGVEMATSEIDVENLATGKTYSRKVLKARIAIAAPRSEVFELITKRIDSAQWDPSHVKARPLHDFGDGTHLYDDLSKFTRFGPTRSGIFLGLTLPDVRPGYSLFCDQSVDAPTWAPPDGYKRLVQHMFLWVVRDRDNGGGCDVQVMLTAPENAWWIVTLMPVMKMGWREVLTKLRDKIEAHQPASPEASADAPQASNAAPALARAARSTME